MASITLPKTEYERLERESKAYRKFAERFFEFVLDDSPSDVVQDFRGTGLYSDDFLKDLEAGLEKSTYGKK